MDQLRAGKKRFHYPRARLSEEESPFAFTDVETKHPQYGAIQKALQSGLFVSAYPDVRQADAPAVAIVHSLGLLPGNNKAFNPDAPLTRAEAAQLMQALLTLKQASE